MFRSVLYFGYVRQFLAWFIGVPVVSVQAMANVGIKPLANTTLPSSITAVPVGELTVLWTYLQGYLWGIVKQTFAFAFFAGGIIC